MTEGILAFENATEAFKDRRGNLDSLLADLHYSYSDREAVEDVIAAMDDAVAAVSTLKQDLASVEKEIEGILSVSDA